MAKKVMNPLTNCQTKKINLLILRLNNNTIIEIYNAPTSNVSTYSLKNGSTIIPPQVKRNLIDG
jgi:hypothetical protein